jgi:stage II sporulation protein GA (sporulation sigma-E factor processing peptidase)
MRVLYIDTLFLINLAADYFLLLLTAKICGAAVKRWRAILSALFGAIYGVASALPMNIFPFGAIFRHPAMVVLSGLALTAIAFGVHRRYALRSLVFFAVSAASGGALYAVMLLGGGNLIARINLRVLIIAFIVVYAAISLVFRRAARAPERLRTVTISVGDETVTLRGLLDTGNSLRDDISGLPVAIVPRRELRRILPSVTTRYIPYCAVGTEGVLPVFRPDVITIDNKPRDMLVAVSETEVSDSGTYSALLPIDN